MVSNYPCEEMRVHDALSFRDRRPQRNNNNNNNENNIIQYDGRGMADLYIYVYNIYYIYTIPANGKTLPLFLCTFLRSDFRKCTMGIGLLHLFLPTFEFTQ